jgi:hypothetical protein
MASASDFLKKRTAARQQAESIQSSDKTPLGKNDDGTVTRASNFLRNKAAERRAVIDQQYGKDAYGGSGRYEADKAQGFNSWLESVNGLSSQLGSDYQSRDGKFQSAADFGKYRDDNDARISVMQNRANAYRTYFQDNREIYGEDAVNGVLSTLDQGSKYLEELRGGLNSEYDFWSQFKDENDYNTYQRGKEYAALAEKPDFAEKSQYKSTANGQEKFNAWSGTYSNSGFDDIAYDYINRNEEARSRQMLSDIQSNASLLGLDNSERREMTDDEIATFNYLYAQDTANGDAEHKNAYAYIDYLTGDLNYRQRAKAEEEWATYAKEHPVGSSAFSVLESPLKGLSYLGQAADYLSDGEIDQNAGYNKFSYINSAIRDEVNTIVEDNWGGVGSFAYQTGMSMGDFLLNTAITGGNQALSLAIMGTGAAADATISAKDRGLSDNQAFALGTIAGAAEIVTEKVSLDALLDKTALTKSAMGYFLKNTLAEGSEEVGSDIINLVADVLISKDKSEWQTSIDAYEAEGMTEKEAFWRAVRDQAENMGLDFLGGAVSGGVMSGVGIATNAGLNEYGARRTGAEFQTMGDDVVQATIQEGLASDPSTQSYKLAVQLQQKLDAGQTLTNAEIGRLYQANVQAIDAEDGSGDLLLRAAEEVTQKGRVTNNTAIDILSNPTAINTLTQEAGLNISEDMSKSQQRKAVKNAVATLARTQSDVSTNARETAHAATEARQTATQEAVRPAMQVEHQRPAAQQAYDIRRVRDAAASLGENGAKALSASYDGSVRADDYYAGFASYYEAGINGADMAKVDSDYGSRLTEAQRFAAYAAGQNDAALSLQREQQAVKYAKVAGEDSGLVYDDFVKQAVESGRPLQDKQGRAILDANGESHVYLTAETAAKVNRVAKALGVRVQFVDSVRGGTANAQISGNTVLVERNNENPVLAIVGHEMTHRMQELAPTEYRTFRDIVAQEEQDSIQKRIDSYAAQGVELTYEQAMDEVAADYAGRLIDDGKVLDDFIERHRDDRTLLQKVRDAIRSLIDKLTGAEKKRAQTAEGKLTAALEAAARQAKTLQGEGGNDTMAATRNSLKEDGKDGQESETGGRPGAGSREGYGQSADREGKGQDGRVRRELSAASGRHGGVNPSFGAKPVRSWAEGHTVEPAKGSAAYAEQRTAVDYGVPSFVVADAAWAKNKGSTPAFSADGQIFFRETLPEKNRGMFAPHEVTHVMRQVGYKPYLDFAERTPTMLNMSDGMTRVLLNHVAEHQHTTLENADPARLYDEFNATMYGHIAVGKADMFVDGPAAHVFHDFDAYAKELGELHERFKADNQKETKFSLKTPVEETDKLLALHNKDENSILAAIKLGGLPMPSIAIVKARDGHTKYGPISLVFSKDTIDPQLFRANKVYGGDAWTPTAPRVDYPVNSKKASQVEHELHRLAGDVSVAGGIFGNSAALRSVGIDDTSTRSTAELAERLASTDTVRAAYLADQGKSLEPVKMDKAWDKFGNDTLQKVVDRLGVNTLAEIEANLETGESVKDALGENAEVIRDILRDYYREQGEPMLRRMAVKRHWTDAEINERRQTRIDNSMDGVSIFTLEDIVHHAWDMYQDGGATKGEIDRMATSDALRSAVDDHAVEEWIAGKLDGLLGEAGIYNGKDPYTPSGNLRSFSQLHYAYTLENIVKAMKEGQEERGGNTWGASAKTLQSVATPEYRSIQEIKADSGRLGMDEGAEYEAKLQAIDDQIGSIITKIKQGNKAHSDNSFVESDIIGSILMETSKGKRTVDAIMRAFSKEGYKISSQTAQDIQAVYQAAAEMPTGYFEAKPQRAVGFDEVLAAVIPDDSSQKLRDGLEQAGVRMLEYKTGDDADRLAKINSVDDARFSLKAGTESKSVAALQEENRLLREQMKDYIDLQRRNGKLRESRDYWQGQTRRTKRVTTDKKAVAQEARELIRSYGADLDAGDITQDLQNLYDYLASGYDGKDELTYTEARRRAEAIAEKLVGNAVAVDETYEQYSDLRAYLRSTTLSLSEEDSRDIPDYGDWRKHQMGRMVIRKGHTNIDQVYQEMSELWPEFFDEQRENNPVDQLLRIAEVMDGIYNVEEYNPFGPYMQQAITGAANEIMERFFDLPQTRATFADRQARKLDDTKAKGRERVQKVREQNAARLAELRQQNRERTTKAVERERTRRAEQIGKLKQRYREKDAAGRERRSARELRAKIMRHASALSQKLLRPSDKQHIPESLRQAVAVMLESINLESAYTTDPNTGKRVKDGSGTPTKRTEAFRALRLAYAEITKDGGDYTLIIDPDLMDNLNELESMKNTPIAEMGTDQLSTVWATLKAVEASIRTANKMLGTSRFETISGFADGIRSDNILRQDRGDYRGVAGKVDRLVNLDMLTPQGYFHRLGKTGEELFRMMRAAQDRHITIMQQAQEKTAEIVGRADVNKLEREKHTFELSGGKVTMSTAQIMGLYELMKRKQAQDHILKGGIRPDTIISGRGLREDRPSAPVKVSVDDLATITGTLTEEQIRIADGLQKFMGGKLAELGNEASMTVYGYRKFTEKDYYPIKVDKNQTKRDISKEAQAATIAGRGFTKSVTPKVNNAVMVESIFDTYSSHVNDMATYAAWLPTMENIRRIRDFTFRDGEGNRTGDVKSIIERVFGKNGNAYLNKLVDDINQGVRPNGTGNFTDALVGNYKAAAVAANIRVILQQPTAILRAMSSLDPKYLLAGTVKRGDWAKVKKYAPIAVWKDWGYFDINTGRQMKDVLLSSDSLMEKVKQAAMAGAGKADSFAWARLWNAAEAETRDKRPGLKPGTEAFYQAVGARFSEIVDQTQVVDGLLQRSQIMRSPDALTKMATSFMAEPTKTYNMFVNAVYDLRHATGKDGRSNAKRALARTSAALVVSFAVNAVMQSIVDALRDDDKERDYWDKFLTAYTGFTGEEETGLDYWNSFWDGNLEANFNPAGYIPYFKDLVSIMQGYDVSRMDMEPVSKVLEAAANMKKALSGEGKYSVAGASANLLAEVSRLLGIPVANLKRDIQAGITTAAIETDNYLMQYRIDKALLNMGYQGNTKNFYDILYNASINDREAYETIYADMVASGMPEDKIRNAMESRMKRDQGVESVGDLELRYLSPSQERRYNSTRNSMAGSTVWTAASRDQQEAAEKDLYDLTVGNDSGEKLQEKIAAGAAYGISEADYLLYRLALHVADQPTENGNLGSYTGEEVQTAIDMLPGLDDEARAYLWEAAGKSEKSNPYK